MTTVDQIAASLVILVVLGLTLATARAEARPSVRLDFITDISSAPEHLCVLTTTRHPLDRSLEQAAGSTLGWSLKLAKLSSVLTPLGPGEGLWRLRPLTEVPEELQKTLAKRPQIEAAFRHLTQPPSDSSEPTPFCDTPFVAACAFPAIETPISLVTNDVENGKPVNRDLFLTCASDHRGRNLNGRVAVVFLSSPQAEAPSVFNLVLNDQVATVVFSGEIDVNAGVVASVAGGHYAPGASEASDRDLHIKLPLVERCSLHEVELPPLNTGALGDVTASYAEEGSPPVTCRPRLDGQKLSMLLPNATTSTKRKRTIEIVTKPPEKMRLVATAERHERWTTLKSRAHQLSFSLRRDCLTPPETACPEAGIGPTSCTTAHADDGRCSYVCSSSNGVSLPAQVTFTRPDAGKQWAETLHEIGQELRDVTPPAERILQLDRSSWWSLKFGKNNPSIKEVSEIELTLGRGATLRTVSIPGSEPDPLRISVPDLRCGEDVRYRYYGSRRFNPETRPTTDGSILLRPPGELVSSRELLRLGLSGTFRTPFSLPAGPLSSLFDMSVDFAFTRQPPDKWYFIDVFRGTVMFGGHPYMTLNAAGTAWDAHTFFPYFHVLVGAGAGLHAGGLLIGANLDIGIGGGPGPVNNSDPRVPTTWAIAPGWLVRKWLAGPLWIRGGSRVLFGDQVRFLNQAGNSAVFEKSSVYFLMDLGLEVAYSGGSTE